MRQLLIPDRIHVVACHDPVLPQRNDIADREAVSPEISGMGYIERFIKSFKHDVPVFIGQERGDIDHFIMIDCRLDPHPIQGLQRGEPLIRGLIRVFELEDGICIVLICKECLHFFCT